MNKKVSLGAAVSFTVIIAAITFTLTMFFAKDIFNRKVANLAEREAVYAKISEIDKIVRDKYTGEINEDDLLNAIAKGYVQGLGDKYAAFFTPEELKAFSESNEGVLEGIGVSASQDESGYIRIREIYKDSPAEQMKLQVDDLIIKVGDQDVKATGYSESVELLKGDAGTKVKITYRRGATDQTVELTRKKLTVQSIYYRMIGENGYIKITDFNEATIKQFNNAIKDLTKQNAKALIFDLRNNGGGTLDSVTSMLDTLLPEGVIATQTDNSGKTTVLGKSDADEVKLPMVCLTNGGTASASELFVAALKDYDKTKVVGLNTYGKGVLQHTFNLKDGSALKLTTAKFNPPKSANFDGVGIKPDYEVKLTAEQERNFDSLDETTDPQLKKAIEVANASR